MSLYRLDIHHPNGDVVPVEDYALRGDFLTRDRNRAISRARGEAELSRNVGAAIVGTRIYGAGSMRESFRITAKR